MASLPSSATALRARWVAPLPTRRWAVSRSHTLAWLLLASAVVVALRVPWFHVPLGNDEGGLTYIARTWHGHGSFVYGDVFIDRPPLLLLLFRVAALTGGTAAVRTIGVVLALLLTLVVTLLARELGGRRAVPWAALLAATLGSSVAIGAVFTPAELPAAVASCSSLLALAVAHRRERGRMRLFFAAGALAVAALLFKQSFLDAVAAGVAYFAAVMIFERPAWRSLRGRLAAFSAGAGAVIAALLAWAWAAGVGLSSLSYALLGFRLDGLHALSGSAGGLPTRFAERLTIPLIASGLFLALLLAWPGLRSLGRRSPIRVAVVVWGLTGAAGVLAGGSYWSHYLIELVPFAAVTAALALSRTGLTRGRMAAITFASIALAGFLLAPRVQTDQTESRRAADVGGEVREWARPSDTIYVQYSQANVIYYSGLRTPYPYDWSLMLRTVTGARAELLHLLRSPRRPTWLVRWERDKAYRFDRNGAIARAVRVHYRRVMTADGHAVLLARGVHRDVDEASAPSGRRHSSLPQVTLGLL